ncbi:MAG: pyruvate dehydrogenase (acetyl-transferring) E1 component subunit alpha [Gammaproteobacteria bacterium]|nr:pyruvate dehydrogenase (acetyl-transferring) E1 component subunit alpha [Gammaproteobacteria bacterium]MBQ0839163.1 pyruvate dehydrogenase (acetyl-transferring) E1 component subunit alpha [Gammaproteobacteria bacterium]
MRGRQQFSIQFLQYLDPEGNLDLPLPAWTDNTPLLHAIYENMVLARLLDQKAVALQRTGQMGTYPSILGQEAISVCTGLAMAEHDVLVPYYRDAPTQIIRGTSPAEIFMYWGGDERGGNLNRASRDLPICVPIGTQLTQAAGVATALKIKGEEAVVVTSCGDGATSKGDFMEALNVAGVWDLPIVFIINNNRWAISMPLAQQTRAATLAQKAIAAGIDGIQVDGNDPIAVYEAISKAIQRARESHQPTLIEALSYRLCDHTTADDASRYRDGEELKAHWKEEPIRRFQEFLHQQGLWDADREKTLQQQCQQVIDAALDEYLAMEDEPDSAIVDYLHAFLPYAMESQRSAIQQRASEENS